MTAEESYEHCNKTREADFVFNKNGQVLQVVFREPYDIGEVYVPALQTTYPIQRFYDGWEAKPMDTRKSAPSA
jgi:hypothetical protein